MATLSATETARTSDASKARRPWSIAAYLLALALITLVPSFVFAGILMQRNHQAQENTIETLILATTRSLVQAVEREINANITTLRVLATTPSLHQGNFRAFHAYGRLALENTRANLFVVNSDYSTLMSTSTPFGSRSVVSEEVVVSTGPASSGRPAERRRPARGAPGHPGGGAADTPLVATETTATWWIWAGSSAPTGRRAFRSSSRAAPPTW
jgi:hypothetical protein